MTTSDRNYVFDPKAMPPTLTRVTDLFYDGGDANEGVDPNIIANAYTNAIPMPTTTLQYGIDAETDSLVTIGNNAGTLTTIGKLYLDGELLDVGSDGGFDILSFAEGDNHAFALFNSAATSGSGLFSIDLDPDATGRVNATLIGSTGRLLDGLAVAPAPVPVPAAALLLGTALGGLRLLRRRSWHRRGAPIPPARPEAAIPLRPLRLPPH